MVSTQFIAHSLRSLFAPTKVFEYQFLPSAIGFLKAFIKKRVAPMDAKGPLVELVQVVITIVRAPENLRPFGYFPRSFGSFVSLDSDSSPVFPFKS